MKPLIRQTIILLTILNCYSAIIGQTPLSGDIESDTTISLDGSPYVVNGALYVFSHVTFTIEPGVIIKFSSPESILQIDGVLKAIGTSDQPIIFTSIKDDTHGGDTNGDGSVTVPMPGDWEGISIYGMHNGNKACQLDYCWIGYGGTDRDGAIDIVYGKANLSNSTISYAASNGIKTNSSSVVAKNCLFENNPESGIVLRHFFSFEELGEENVITLLDNTFINNAAFAVMCSGVIQNVKITLENNISSGSKGNGFAIEDFIVGKVTLNGQDNFPYILIKSLIVGEADTLNILPGTIVKLYESALKIDGSLIAIGTPEDSIKFTSLANDNIHGDTNGDGSMTQPHPGQWGGIYARDGYNSSVHLEYCHLSFGGSGTYFGLVYSESDNVTVRNSLLMHSQDDGAFIKNCSPIFEENIFLDNAHGIFCNGLSHEKHFVLKNNTFINNKYRAAQINLKDNVVNITAEGNEAFGNSKSSEGDWFTQNGLTLKGNITGNVTFTGQSNAFPFMIFNTLSIDSSALLNLSPGTIFKGKGLLEVFGTLNAVGTENSPIVFTALADDQYGGDVNEDGSSTQPKRGDSGSIRIKSSTKGTNLVNCIFRYGGKGAYYANEEPSHIFIKGDDITISNSLIELGRVAGVCILNAKPTLENNIFRNNKMYGIYNDKGALPAIMNNNIYDNPQAGVFNNDTTVNVDARNNWWGDVSGPFHPTKNVSGLGNDVSDYVLFDPWLEMPIDETLSSNLSSINSSNIPFKSYPSPFIAYTSVYFELMHGMDISLDLFDATGKHIRNVANTFMPAGSHEIEIQCTDLEQGIYFLKLTTSQGYGIVKLVHLAK